MADVQPDRRVTLTMLRRWHRALSSAHDKAVTVFDEVNAALGEDDGDAVVIGDPIIELHAALSCIEGMIDEREKARAAIAKAKGQPT